MIRNFLKIIFLKYMYDTETSLSAVDEVDKSFLYELHDILKTRVTPPNLIQQSLQKLFGIFTRQTNVKLLDKTNNILFDLVINAPPEISRATVINLGEFGRNNGDYEKNIVAVDILGRVLNDPKNLTWERKNNGREETVSLHDIAIESISAIANSTAQGNEKEGTIIKEAMGFLDEFNKNCSTYKDFTPQTSTVSRASKAWKSIATKTQKIKGFDALDTQPVFSLPRNATLLRK